MYAARRQGLTAVPVIQGIAAVVTTATCLAAPCKLLTAPRMRGGMLSYAKPIYTEVRTGIGTVKPEVQHSVHFYPASFMGIPESQPGHSKSCQSKCLRGVRRHRGFSRYVHDKGRNDFVAQSPVLYAASGVP